MHRLRRVWLGGLLLAAGLMLNLWAQSVPHEIEQACQLMLAPLNQTFSAVGGTSSFIITASAANCEWMVRSNAPWLGITSATRGSGSATINFTVAPSVSARSGTLSVNGRLFTVWQAVLPCAEPNFALAQAFVPGLGSSELLYRDFNNDGLGDLLALGGIAPTGSRILLVANGKREGGFEAPRSLSLGYNNTTYAQIEAADFNRDGKLDVVLADYYNVYVNFGDGAGGIGAPQRYPITVGGVDLAVGDFNGDRYPDVIVAGGLAVLLNDGMGRLKPETVIRLTETQTNALRLATGDFNNDGKLDLLYLEERSFRFLVLPGNGAGGFERGAFYDHVDRGLSGVVQPSALALGDVTGDGRLDVVVGSRRGLSVVPALSSGGFGEAMMYLREQPLDGVFLGDFNGDGVADLVGTNGVRAFFLRGLGTGRFAEPLQFLIQGRTFTFTDAQALDWNRDGLTDLVITTASPDLQSETLSLAVIYGNRLSGLSAPQGVPLPVVPNEIATADVNGDDLPDLLLSYPVNQGGSVVILAGNGAGGFSQIGSYPAYVPAKLEVRDVNNDGAPDFIVASSSRADITVWLNNGRGSFAQVAELEANNFVAGDFNNDGKLDLLVSIYNEQSWRLLLGNGDSTFRITAERVLFSYFNSAVTGDFNGDGKLDLATWLACDLGQRPGVLLGNGQGGFTAPMQLTLREDASTFVAGDLNGDGRTDLIASLCSRGSGEALVVFLATANGFAAPVYYPEGDAAKPLLADINSDGKLDLLTRNAFNLLTLGTMYINRGDGTLIVRRIIAPNQWALADTNQDGLNDLLFFQQTGAAGSLLFVIRNQTRCATASDAIATSAASFLGYKPAAGSIATLFGANLAAETRAATGVPLPPSLAGTTVSLRDSGGHEQTLPLFFVSPGLVNISLPDGLPPGIAVATINRNGAATARAVLEVAQVNPGLFAADATGTGFPAGVVLRIKSDGSQVFEPVAQFNAALNRFSGVPIDLSNAAEQIFLILFGTGWRNRSALANVTAKLGGQDGEVTYAGRQGSLVGLDQANLRLPRSLVGSGEVDLTLTVDGKASNLVRVSIK